MARKKKNNNVFYIGAAIVTALIGLNWIKNNQNALPRETGRSLQISRPGVKKV